MKKKILLLVLLLPAVMYSQEVLKLQNGASLTLQAGAQLTVLGGVSLENGSVLSNSGTVTIKQNAIAGAADLFDNSIAHYSYGPGKFVFNSTGLQNVSSNNNFGRIDIDGAGIVLYSDVIANKWWLAKGNVNAGNFKTIILGTSSTDLEADPANSDFSHSWITGTIRRYINPAVTNNYVFPLINGTYKNFIRLDNLTANPLTGVQYLDVSLTAPKPGTDEGLLVTENGAQYVAVNNSAVWHLVPDNAPAGGKFDLALYFDGFTGLTDNSFGILQRPDQSSNPAEWTVPAGSSLNPLNGAGRLVSDGYALRKDVSSFGQFGIGQFLLNALPVTLSKFNAKRFSGLSVQLDWQTASEFNNKGFGIERRFENETSFSSQGFVNSKALTGNSQFTLNYYFTDNNNYRGITYYRLKQTDKDDHTFYSMIKAVNGIDGSAVSVLLWPNPARGQFSIQLTGITGKKEAVITDLQGKLLRKINVSGTQQVDVSGLKAGMYVLTIADAFGKNQHFKEKIVVIK